MSIYLGRFYSSVRVQFNYDAIQLYLGTNGAMYI